MKYFSLALFFILGLNTVSAQEPDTIKADPERIESRILALSKFGKNENGGTDRVAYSDAYIAGQNWLIQEMRGLGLDVRQDAAGNIIGRRPGTDNDLPVIMFGSHIDSVPDGGNYDGDVGVMTALEVIEMLNAASHTTTHPLEVVSFSDEEGGLIGSLALTGHLKPATLDNITHTGLTIGEGINRIGGNVDALETAIYDPADLKAFIEVHIEQGAILDQRNIDIGVVEGIVGIRWWNIEIEGMANHAGTTPMNQRRDAMVAAAQMTLAINQTALTMEGRQVATVGRIEAFPGAPNVIPGRVVMSLEIRDLESDKITTVFESIKAKAEDIAEETETSIRFIPLEVASEPAPTDPRMRDIIARAANSLNLSYLSMPSGAGHDSQDMATITPTGMIFVPSEKGISHAPDEYTTASDMANGADVLLQTILQIDTGALNDMP